jgi:hypothetical protein
MLTPVPALCLRCADHLQLFAGAAQATEEVADFAASGLIFKDTVHVIEQEDPQGEGMSLTCVEPIPNTHAMISAL